MRSNWKDAPHLFANGKFKVSWMDGEIIDDPLKFGVASIFQFIDDYTLIARKIEDLSDEECGFISEVFDRNNDVMKRSLAHQAQHELLRQNVFLYLLSIGVYPFDQSHFESGEVIDVKELEEKDET